MMTRLGFPVLVSVFVFICLSACTQKKAGFTVPGSSFRFQTQAFEDPNVLAEVDGQTFTRSQILDKSQVLADLDQQEQDIKAGLVYMYAQKLVASGKVSNANTLKIYVTPSTEDLKKILLRFGVEPGSLKVSFAKSVGGTVLGEFGDVEITPEQIDQNHFVFQSIQGRRTREIAQQLSQQLSRILINQKAKESNQDLQTYLQQTVFKGPVSISDEDIRKYAKSISLAEGEINDEMRERLRQALKERKETELMETYVAENILKEPVRVAFAPGDAKLDLDASFAPIKGYKSAPISVVVFSSAACPDCFEAIYSTVTASNEFDGYLKVNWIHMPQANDSMSNLMSEAAICAEAQKRGASLDFMLAFGKNVGQAAEAEFTKWAEQQGFDGQSFHDCILQGLQKDLLSKHLAYAKGLGIIANPTVWVNGQMLEGVIKEETLRQAVKQKIDHGGYSPWDAFLRRWKYKLGLN